MSAELPFDLYLVTNRRAVAGGTVEALERVVLHVARAVPRGSLAVQLRDKDLPFAQRHALAHRLAEALRETGALLLVNGRADAAACSGAWGVHLGGDAPPAHAVRKAFGERLHIGVSTHHIDELYGPAATCRGADFAVFGPVQRVPGKPGAPVGIEGFARAARVAEVPLVALGGVDASNAAALVRAGAAAVACIRAVLSAPDAAAAAAKLVATVRAARSA